MLYILNATGGKFDKIEPVAFKDFSSFGNLEKDLEELIAQSILDVLFEDASLMPIFQERQYQAEADVYALNKKGELTIFELKRGAAGEGAVHQALRYAQDAGQWSYAQLQAKYQQYTGSTSDLHHAHKEAFDLDHPLDPKEINSKQHLVVIGSAADEGLINAVDYWSRQGVSISFLFLIESMNWAAIIISSSSHCPTTDTRTQPVPKGSCLTRIEAGTKSLFGT